MSQKTLRIGIVGFGSRGVSFVAPVLDNSIHNRIAVVVDPDESRSRYFLGQCVAQGQIPADEAEAIRFVKDIGDLSAGEADVLFLTASERVRSLLFPQAVDFGAHIYMEKGLAADLDGARRVVQAMDRVRPGQQVFMGFNLRHYPPLVLAKRILDQGRIGRILHVQYQEMMDYRHGGSFYMRFHRDVRNSGGMMVTKACHDFDLLGHFVGARPERVFSAQYKRLFGRGGPEAREQCATCDRAAECDWDRMRNQPTRAAKRKYAKVYLDEDKVTTDGYSLDLCCWRSDTELRDLSNVLIEYENAIPATYTQVLFAPQGNRIVQVLGDNGSLVCDERQRTVVVTDRWNTTVDRLEVKAGRDGHGGSDTGVVSAFFQSIRDGIPPESTIADGVWALATAFAAYQSAEREQWTPVRPIVESVGAGLSDTPPGRRAPHERP